MNRSDLHFDSRVHDSCARDSCVHDSCARDSCVHDSCTGDFHVHDSHVHDSHVRRADSYGRRRRKSAKFYKLDYLHRWKALLEAPVDQDGEDVFRDVEKRLYKSGLHSKLTAENSRYVLYVRESEFEYAKDLTDGAVTDVYGKTVPEYVLFKDDYEYKNEKFYQDVSNSRRMRINARMTMFITAIIIIVTMMILYYVTR